MKKSKATKLLTSYHDPRQPGSLGGVCLLVEGRGSRVEGRGSRVEGRGSRVEGRGSRVEGRGSRDEGRG